MNVYNDDDNSVYFELGYSTEVSEVAVDFFVGGTPGGDELDITVQQNLI